MASVKSSVINLTKTIVGAGLFAVPFAFKADGIVLGLFLIGFAAVVSAFGLNIVTRVSIENLAGKETSFFHLCEITYPKLTLLFDFSIFLQCFGVALSYLVIVGDIIPGLISDILSRNQVILLSAVITLPLICLKKLDSLKIGSLIGLFAIFFLTCLIILHALIDDVSLTQGNLKVWTFGSWDQITSSFSIIVFAFTAAQNICTITNEIENPNDMNKVVFYSVGIASILFIVVGLSGYYQFGDNILGNVILNYDSSLITTKIGKFTLVLMVILSFPLMFHPCRISFNNMIHWIESEFKKDSKIDGENERLLDEEIQSDHSPVPFPQSRFIIESIILICSLYGLALSITSFELVLALVGATGSTLICFILPGLFGFKLLKSFNDRILSLSLSIWGFIVMILAVYSSLHN